MAVIIIGGQELLDPLDTPRHLAVDAPRELDGVGHRERHVAVNHDGEVRAAGGAHCLDALDVLAHAHVSIRGAVREGDLAPKKAQLLAELRARGGAVDGQLLLGLSTQQLVHGLAQLLAQRVPDGEVHRRDGLDGQALAAVVDGATPHLVPHELRVAHVLPLHKARKVLLNDVARRRAPNGDAHANDARSELHLGDHRAQRINAPRLARSLHLRKHRARVGDGLRWRALEEGQMEVGGDGEGMTEVTTHRARALRTVSTIQWPWAWEWQSAPPPAASCTGWGWGGQQDGSVTGMDQACESEREPMSGDSPSPTSVALSPMT